MNNQTFLKSEFLDSIFKKLQVQFSGYIGWNLFPYVLIVVDNNQLFMTQLDYVTIRMKYICCWKSTKIKIQAEPTLFVSKAVL